MLVSKEQIAKDIINLANSQVGVREVGFNSGKEVESYQKAVDNKAMREAWCMAFVQWVIKKVCAQYGIKTVLYPSENCQQVYIHTMPRYQSSVPVVGGAFIHQSRTVSYKGHTGIVTGKARAGVFPATEGNTNKAGSSEGDGVYKKYRYTAGNATKRMRGYIDIPQMIYDEIQKNQAGEKN